MSINNYLKYNPLPRTPRSDTCSTVCTLVHIGDSRPIGAAIYKTHINQLQYIPEMPPVIIICTRLEVLGYLVHLTDVLVTSISFWLVRVKLSRLLTQQPTGYPCTSISAHNYTYSRRTTSCWYEFLISKLQVPVQYVHTSFSKNVNCFPQHSQILWVHSLTSPKSPLSNYILTRS